MKVIVMILLIGVIISVIHRRVKVGVVIILLIQAKETAAASDTSTTTATNDRSPGRSGLCIKSTRKRGYRRRVNPPKVHLRRPSNAIDIVRLNAKHHLRR